MKIIKRKINSIKNKWNLTSAQIILVVLILLCIIGAVYIIVNAGIASQITKHQNISMLIVAITLALYFAFLIPFRFENASGISEAGIGFSITGVLLLAFMGVSIVNQGIIGYQISTPEIVIVLISLCAIAGGIKLIQWDLK